MRVRIVDYSTPTVSSSPLPIVSVQIYDESPPHQGEESSEKAPSTTPMTMQEALARIEQLERQVEQQAGAASHFFCNR